MGAGGTEVIEGIFGVKQIDAGEIVVKGKKLRSTPPADAIQHGLALLTEDRKLTGIMGVLPVKDNMMIASLRSYADSGFSQQPADRRNLQP